jgi:hypothetical protein
MPADPTHPDQFGGEARFRADLDSQPVPKLAELLERLALSLRAGSSEADRFNRARAVYRQVVDRWTLRTPEPNEQVRASWRRRR